MLLEVLSKIEEATGIKPIPFSTSSVSKDCIVYNLYSNADNGTISRKRLELRLITHSLKVAEAQKCAILNALVTVGDEKKIDAINKCELNGGGQLRDEETETIHTILYFDLISRSSLVGGN